MVFPAVEDILGVIHNLETLKNAKQDYRETLAAKKSLDSFKERELWLSYVQPTLDIVIKRFEELQLYGYIQNYGTGTWKSRDQIDSLLGVSELSLLSLEKENIAIGEVIKELKTVMKNLPKPANSKAGEASGGEIDSQSIDSQNEREDIVDLKPNFCGIGLNINALIRKKKWGTKIKNLLKRLINRKSLPK